MLNFVEYGKLKVEDHLVLKDYNDAFKILGFIPKMDVDFFIKLMMKVALVSQVPYRMITPELI